MRKNERETANTSLAADQNSAKGGNLAVDINLS